MYLTELLVKHQLHFGNSEVNNCKSTKTIPKPQSLILEWIWKGNLEGKEKRYGISANINIVSGLVKEIQRRHRERGWLCFIHGLISDGSGNREGCCRDNKVNNGFAKEFS